MLLVPVLRVGDRDGRPLGHARLIELASAVSSIGRRCEKSGALVVISAASTICCSGVGHRRGESGDLPLIGDVACEGGGHSTVGADGADDVERQCPTVGIIDRHGQAIARQASRDRAPES